MYATVRVAIRSAGSGGSAEHVGQRVDQRDPLPRRQPAGDALGVGPGEDGLVEFRGHGRGNRVRRPGNAQSGGDERPHEVQRLADQEVRRETAGLLQGLVVAEVDPGVGEKHHRRLAWAARVPAAGAALVLGQQFGETRADREQCPAAQVSSHFRPGQERHAVPGVSGRVGQRHQRQQVPGGRHAAEQYPHVFLSLVEDVVSRATGSEQGDQGVGDDGRVGQHRHVIAWDDQRVDAEPRREFGTGPG